MKSNFFEMLMYFVENVLEDIKHQACPEASTDLNDQQLLTPPSSTTTNSKNYSLRIFTTTERLKLSKASYQFIMRLMLLHLIPTTLMEEIIHQLWLSDSHFVTLQETKHVILEVMRTYLNPEQFIFFEFVLTQPTNTIGLH